MEVDDDLFNRIQLNEDTNTIINLSNFVLQDRHKKLLQKGLSFSPTGVMNQFKVFKDITLFLRKVYEKQVHQEAHPRQIENT